MNKTYYSFDIYDTCLARKCGLPDNVYFLLACKIGITLDMSLQRAFIIERKAAEKRAEQRFAKESVTIDEIYATADFSFCTQIPNNQIMAYELGIERQICVPILKTKSIIHSLRKKGDIVFISDMYLPSTLMRDILIDADLWEDGDSIYVSGEIGKTKRSGHLFDHVKESRGGDPKCHYGDNLYGDYLIPKSKGIKAKRIINDFSGIEQKWLDEDKFYINKFCPSIFSGLIRSLRLKHYQDTKDHFLTNIMLPLLLPFVQSVINRAKAKGVQVLYFASRDTYGMYLIAKELSKSDKSIELKYLHISTKVLYPLYIEKGTKEELEYILHLLGRFKLKSLLGMLGICPEESILFLGEANLDRELSIKDEDYSSFFDKLTTEENLKRIYLNTQRMREHLKGYLVQEGFLKTNRKVGLVDVGWRLTCQEMLNKIIDEDKVEYYYLGVSRSRQGISKTGSFTSMSYWEDLQAIYPNKNYIEYYICRANEGSTIGYEEREGAYYPVLSDRKDTDDIDIKYVNELLVEASKFYASMEVLISFSEEIFSHISIKTIYDFTKIPPKAMVDFLSDKLYYEHFSNRLPIIPKLYPWTCIRLVFSYFSRIRCKGGFIYKYRFMWINASLIHTYGVIGKWGVELYWKIKESRKLKDYVKQIAFTARSYN